MMGDLNLKIYKNYMKEINGDYSAEKQDWLLSEQEKFQKYIDDKDVYDEKFNNGEIEQDDLQYIFLEKIIIVVQIIL